MNLKKSGRRHGRTAPWISEVKSNLQFDGSAGKSPLSFAELCTVDKGTVVAELEVIEIKLIEDVKEVRSQINTRSFF